MTRWMIAALLMTGASLWTLPAAAKAHSGSAARGRQIAIDLCSTCHVVAPDQDVPPVLKQPTPSFQAIADRPGVSAEALRRFLGATHWDQKTVPVTMPSPMLSAQQKSDVVGYIFSLRRRP